MKKLIFLFLVYFVFFHSLEAQYYCNSLNINSDTLKCDIYTPKCNPVVTWAMSEDPQSVRSAFDDAYTKSYPNAQKIITYDNLSSTRRFNCHGYAWLKVEGGPDRWIGYDFGNRDPDIYMTDTSYIQVPSETYPGKVFWGRESGGDHTAVTTSQQGVFISKWNRWPLMRHAWNYSPFGSSNLKYYVRSTISGPDQICTSATYQVTNLPAGATVTWSATPSGRVSLQSSGNNVIITKVSDGAITLTANINTSSSTLTQPIHVGKPNYWGTITDLNNPSLAYGLGGQYITFTFIPNAPAPILGAITGYQWGYYKAVSAGNNITIIQSGNTTSNTWSVGISEPVGKYVVYVNPYNSCGTFEMNNMAVITIGNPSGPDPELPYFIVPPSNPTNSVINGKK